MVFLAENTNTIFFGRTESFLLSLNFHQARPLTEAVEKKQTKRPIDMKKRHLWMRLTELYNIVLHVLAELVSFFCLGQKINRSFKFLLYCSDSHTEHPSL